MSRVHRHPLTVAILAGGNGSRLNHINKALMPIAGIAAYQRVLHAFAPAAPDVTLINTHRDIDTYPARFNIINEPERDGPFSGLLAILMATPSGAILLTAPCDAVHLPADYATTMVRAVQQHSVVYASHGGQIEPLCLGLQVTKSLKQHAEQHYRRGQRSLKQWLREIATIEGTEDITSVAAVEFNDADAIWSINTPAERNAAEQQLSC